jgi:hypothetical protein
VTEDEHKSMTATVAISVMAACGFGGWMGSLGAGVWMFFVFVVATTLVDAATKRMGKWAAL